LALCSVAPAQQSKKPLSVEDLESLLGRVTGRAVVSVIEGQGVKFEVTEAVKERLRKAGADTGVIAAVERASIDYARKKLAAERQQFEVEKKRVEEERQKEETQRREDEKKAAADAKRRAEEDIRQQEVEKKRADEVRQKEETQRREEEEKAAANAKRKAEEETRLQEEKKRAEAATSRPIRPGSGDMVAVPAGIFWTGCNEQAGTECDNDTKPGRRIEVDAFEIDRTEVTVAAYRQCVQQGECSRPNTGGECNYDRNEREEHPVNCIDWQQAWAYCRWAGKRLPREAEWEKAARGPDGWKYPWGNQWDAQRVNGFGDADGYPSTAPVEAFPPGASPYGALNMAGNVWEWTADWKNADKGVTILAHPRDISEHSAATGLIPGHRGEDLGFRCAR
jgi:formylglycine-generating enzyme required for sulfatase activity